MSGAGRRPAVTEGRPLHVHLALRPHAAARRRSLRSVRLGTPAGEPWETVPRRQGLQGVLGHTGHTLCVWVRAVNFVHFFPSPQGPPGTCSGLAYSSEVSNSSEHTEMWAKEERGRALDKNQPTARPVWLSG